MTDLENAPGLSGSVARLCERLTQACRAIAGVALLVIVAVNGANVVARYFFGRPFSWAEEFMLFCMILSVFAGAIAVTWRDLHIRIDTFVERASRHMRSLVKVLATAISIAVLLTVMTSSYQLVWLLYQSDQRTDALDAPMWIPQSFVTIGLALIALLMAVRIIVSKAR